MDIPHPAIFWNETVVSRFQQSPYIHHAVAALGAAHWLFLSGVDHVQVRRFITSQYNQAVNDLIPQMTAGERPDYSSVMICCLLFICLESLRGNQIVALHHMESSCRLFLDDFAPLSESDSSLQDLEAIFHMLANQAGLFSGSRVLTDPAPHLSCL